MSERAGRGNPARPANMTTRTIDYDPITGMRVTFDYHPHDDSVTIGHHQDVQNLMDDCHWSTLDLDAHKRQSKNGWAAYAKIPEIAILDMKARFGVDFFDKDHWPRVMQLINTEYKRFKRTTYNHDR